MSKAAYCFLIDIEVVNQGYKKVYFHSKITEDFPPIEVMERKNFRQVLASSGLVEYTGLDLMSTC